VVFSGAGNIATCGTDRDEKTAALLDAIVAANPDAAVFAAGDNVFPPETMNLEEAYRGCYHASWGRHLERTWAALGNHEYDARIAKTPDGAFDYFGDRVGPRGLGYYSFDLGDWHVIVLNDNIDISTQSAQLSWLAADLAQNASKRCTMAIWHAPLFLSSNSADYMTNGDRRVLWERLHAAGAELVVNAQQHFYERFPPLDPQGQPDPNRGIVQINVGTGGESVATPEFRHPQSAVVNGNAYGVLKLTLTASGYTWEFVPIAGHSFTDSGSGTCH
jgi:hypothetical protein